MEFLELVNLLFPITYEYVETAVKEVEAYTLNNLSIRDNYTINAHRAVGHEHSLRDSFGKVASAWILYVWEGDVFSCFLFFFKISVSSRS